MESKYLNISWESLWRVLFMLMLGWVLFIAKDVVAALLLAIVISAAFDPAVTFLERRRIPRILGTLLVYLAVVAVIAVIVYTFVPVVITELGNFADASDSFLGSILSTFKVESLAQTVSINLEKLNELLFSGTFSIVDLTSRVFGGVLFAVATFVLSFYLTLGRDGVEKFFVAVLPTAYEARVLHIYTRVRRKIGRWLAGQLFLSVIVGVLIFAGLWLLGVRYALFLGILAAISELVPYVGPIFTGSLSILVALSDSFPLAVYVFILFTIVQQLESQVLVPAVMRYTTALNPVVILAALLIGGKVFGIVGFILAVPVAVLVQEVVEDLAQTRQRRKTADA